MGKIVFAEANITQAEMLKYMFQGHDHEIIHGSDGLKALELVRIHKPDLVITDVMMPEMNGIELCRAIKNDPELSSIPVLLLTTLSSAEDLMTGLDAGADTYLLKPFEERFIFEWVEKLIKQDHKGFLSRVERLENFLFSTYELVQGRNIQLKSAQKQLHQLNASLKQQVAEQTHILRKEIEEKSAIEEALQKAKEQAEQADSLKTAFLNNLSHEIRTPMNAIMGFSSFLSDPHITDQERMEFVGHIEQGCQNLLNIINSIVDMAVLESNKIEPSLSECHLHEFLYEIFDEFSRQEPFISGEVALTMDHPPSEKDIVFHTDQQRLKQVLLNLLKNAQKFTEKGKIALGYTIPEEGLIEFQVRDTGPGIAKDKLSYIFERFTKLDQAAQVKHPGAGVGLAITRKLVEFLGGSIRVESDIGIGSVFYVSLPLHHAYPKKGKPAKKAKDDEINWNDLSILVAEDVDSNFHLIEFLLKNLGVEILWAKNGKEAVEFVESGRRIDVILMDIQMPVMDGYIATEMILKMNPNIPVIAQTAYAMSYDEEKILNAGFSRLLTKPISKKELIDTLTRVLSGLHSKNK